MNMERTVRPTATPRNNKDKAKTIAENEAESALDEALEETFPASDAVAVNIEKLSPDLISIDHHKLSKVRLDK